MLQLENGKKQTKQNTDVEIKTLKSHGNNGSEKLITVRDIIAKIRLLISAHIFKCILSNLFLSGSLTYNQKL